jgi:hypothetical protein
MITYQQVFEIFFIGFLVANFANLIRKLCEWGNEYGSPPFASLHYAVANYLQRKNKKTLLRLWYCFICQSVWYGIATAFFLYHNQFMSEIQAISLPLVTFFFANLIIKNTNFMPPKDAEL